MYSIGDTKYTCNKAQDLSYLREYVIYATSEWLVYHYILPSNGFAAFINEHDTIRFIHQIMARLTSSNHIRGFLQQPVYIESHLIIDQQTSFNKLKGDEEDAESAKRKQNKHMHIRYFCQVLSLLGFCNLNCFCWVLYTLHRVMRLHFYK